MKSMKRSFFLTGVWLLCVKNASLVVIFLDLSSCIFNGNRHQHHLLLQNLVWFDKSKFPLLWSVDQTKHFTTNLILCQVILSCLSTYFVYPYLDILVMHKTFTKTNFILMSKWTLHSTNLWISPLRTTHIEYRYKNWGYKVLTFKLINQ